MVHHNISQVKQSLQRNNIEFLDDVSDVCHGCCMCKLHRLSYKLSQNKSIKKCGEIRHADLFGTKEQLVNDIADIK